MRKDEHDRSAHGHHRHAVRHGPEDEAILAMRRSEQMLKSFEPESLKPASQQRSEHPGAHSVNSDHHGQRAGLIIGGFLFLMGAFGSIGVLNARFLDSKIELDKQAVQAVVLKKELIRAADGDSDYLITYRFALPDGRELTSQRGLPRKVWSDLKVGQQIQVLYAKEMPSRNFPRDGGGVSLGGAIAAGVVFGLVGLLGGAVLVASWRQRASTKQRRSKIKA